MVLQATMSDGKGFVEGMDEQTAMQFVRVHPWVLQHILGDTRGTGLGVATYLR